ncbi:hypothetical protein V8G54_007166 [Vigna mungo]|uniref:Uncharacterized protein n=1 Tax=Vigna mungo TaxID=3915 RepID=A0AAQ3P156_VIGMU
MAFPSRTSGVSPGPSVCIELVPDGAKARPTGFSHDEGMVFVDHDVEEVTVAGANGEVVTEVERVFLEKRDVEGDLGIQRVEVVRLEVDQEAEIGILQELEERTKELIEGSRLQLSEATRDVLHLLGVVVGGVAGSGVGDTDAGMGGVREEAEKSESHVFKNWHVTLPHVQKLNPVKCDSEMVAFIGVVFLDVCLQLSSLDVIDVWFAS